MLNYIFMSTKLIFLFVHFRLSNMLTSNKWFFLWTNKFILAFLFVLLMKDCCFMFVCPLWDKLLVSSVATHFQWITLAWFVIGKKEEKKKLNWAFICKYLSSHQIYQKTFIHYTSLLEFLLLFFILENIYKHHDCFFTVY